MNVMYIQVQLTLCTVSIDAYRINPVVSTAVTNESKATHTEWVYHNNIHQLFIKASLKQSSNLFGDIISDRRLHVGIQHT